MNKTQNNGDMHTMMFVHVVYKIILSVFQPAMCTNLNTEYSPVNHYYTKKQNNIMS